MTKIRRLTLFILPAFIVGGLLWFALHTGEPSYQGKRLGQWLKEFETEDQRAEAGHAIQQMGTNALPRLLEMLQSTDSRLKQRVQNFLNSHSPVRINLGSANNARTRAVAAFEVLGAAAKPAIPTLTNLLDHSNSDVRSSAIYSLASMGIEAENAVPALLQMLKDKEPGVGALAAIALGIVGRESAAVIPALTVNLQDTDRHVFGAAVRALGQFGDRSLPALAKAAETRTGAERRESLSVLASIGSAAAVSILTNYLRDPDPTTKVYVIHYLSRMTNEKPAIISLLSASLSDSNSHVAGASAGALGAFGAESKAAVPALLSLWKSENADSIRWLVAQALLQIDPETATNAGVKLENPLLGRRGRR